MGKSMDYNKLVFVARLAVEPRMRYTPEGKAVCDLFVLSNISKDKTIAYSVTAWDRAAEFIAQYGTKGTSVLVEGKLVPDENGNPGVYTKKDGTVTSSFKVSASSIQIMNKWREGAAATEDIPEDEEAIPF